MLVILYVMDSLRPDYLSCYGHPEGISPNMDAIAADGVLFENAFAQASWTRPSGASMLTSTYPTAHNVMFLDSGRLAGLPTLPEVMRLKGFASFGVTSMVNISSDFGFDRGFDRLVELYREDSVRDKRPKYDAREAGRSDRFDLDRDGVVIPTAEDINDYLFKAIDESGDKDLFAFAWAIDTHGPYFHRDPELARYARPDGRVIWSKQRDKLKSGAETGYLKDLYRDMVHYNDYHIGALRRKLMDTGLYDDTLLILTADHGEGFGEHGKNGHAGLPYDEQIRVPLIMKFPNNMRAGKRVAGMAQHIDIFPTITGYTGTGPGSPAVQGRDLMPLVTGEAGEVNEFVMAEVRINEDAPMAVSVRTRDTKYIELQQDGLVSGDTLKKKFRSFRKNVKRRISGLKFLYDLRTDPDETTNLAGKSGYAALGDELASAYAAQFEKNKKLSGSLEDIAPELDTDDEVRKQLQALGYMD